MVAGNKRKRSGRRAGSFRTCCACHKRLPRGASLRLVREPVRDDRSGGRLLPDLTGKYPGRGVHVCPDLACIRRATQQAPSKNHRARGNVADAGELADAFLKASEDRIRSYLGTSLRSGWLAAGRTPVREALQAKQVALLLLARDASPGLVREMRGRASESGFPCFSMFAVEELSSFHHGKPLAVLAIRHRGIARRMAEEMKKVNLLTESMERQAQNPRSKLTGKSDRGKMPQQRGVRAGSPVNRS